MKLVPYVRDAYRKTTRWHLVALGCLLIITANVTFQMLYPQDHAPLFARVFGMSVGQQKYDTIVGTLQDHFLHEKVTISVGDVQKEIVVRELGVEYYYDEIARQAVTYPIEYRLIPFSYFWYSNTVDTRLVRISDAVFEQKATTLVQDFSKEPKNAGIAVQGDEITITKAQKGYKITTDMLRQALNQTMEGTSRHITLEPIVKNPIVTDARVADVEQQARAIFDQNIVIAGDDITRRVPDKVRKARWFSIEKDNGIPKLKVMRDAVASYAKGVYTVEYRTPTSQRVTIVDGVAQEGTGGKNGSAIDQQYLTDQLIAAIASQKDTTITLARNPIAYGTTYERTYSSTQAGLRAYVDYTSRYENTWIAFSHIGGKGWTAEGRAWESIPSASTYKLFVAMRLGEAIERGDLTYQTPMLDTDVAGCFERMIVPSTNQCALQWLDDFGGREAMTQYVHSKGFSQGTGFTFSDAVHTTAGDLRKMLIGIDNGTLVSGTHRTMLLEKMGRQLYRTGIPAGTSAHVQDKVGFLWDYVHDAAIVYHPQGKYVLVVMTKGYGNYAKMKEIAREIESIIYP